MRLRSVSAQLHARRVAEDRAAPSPPASFVLEGSQAGQRRGQEQRRSRRRGQRHAHLPRSHPGGADPVRWDVIAPPLRIGVHWSVYDHAGALSPCGYKLQRWHCCCAPPVSASPHLTPLVRSQLLPGRQGGALAQRPAVPGCRGAHAAAAGPPAAPRCVCPLSLGVQLGIAAGCSWTPWSMRRWLG